MFYYKLVCCASIMCIVAVAIGQAKGLQKRFFVTANSCFTQNCWECQCSHLEKHKDRIYGDDNDVCKGQCNGHTCTNIKYGDLCAIWNHGISQWNNWENWSSCSKSCGGGTMSRTRTCPVHVYPSTCIGGSDQETNHCNTKSCSVDGGWSPWQNISNCSATCGTGFIMQVRFCDNPAPSNGGQLCQGDQWNKIPCLLSPCPIDGGWSSWKDSSTCSHTCGSGTMMQTRTCDSPYPVNGGHDCAGSRSKFVSCNTQPCPVDGSWSSWKNSSTCSNTCGGGIMMQTRTCNSPNPANGGQNCTGSQSKFISCNNQPCPAVNINKFPNVTNGGSSPSASQQVTSTTNRTTVSILTNGGGISQNQQVSSTTIQTILSSNAGGVTSLGPSQQIQTTVNQSMLSNFTNGGTSQGTSFTGPLPTKQNKTGGLGLTTGITNTVGITQIVTGPTVLASKKSSPQITSNTTTWSTETSGKTTLPSSVLFTTTQMSSTKVSTTQTNTQTSTTPLMSKTQMPPTQAPRTYNNSLTSTTLLISKTQNSSTQGSTTHNNSPTSCVLCSGPSYICEQRHHKEQCPDVSHQYCINKMTNNRDGTRLLERRCATKNECEIDWWQNTSDRDECTKYDVTQAVFRIFKCTYCCSGPFCNEHLIPKNLYLGHH